MARKIIHEMILIAFACSLAFAGNVGDDRQLHSFDKGIKVDGYLNEDVWKKATRISNFYTFQPTEGDPAGERTALLLGYDANNLYVAIICFYDDPKKIRASITKRGNIFDDDFVILYLDTFDDAKNAYQLAFNPYGIQADGIYTEHGGEDFNPDYIFESFGRIFQKGYIVEARIPFSSLNFPNKNVMNWRFGCLRRTQYLNHDVVWPKMTRFSTEWVAQLGRLNDIRAIRTNRPIDILPEYSFSRGDKLNSTTNKLSKVLSKGDFGASFKYGITSSLNTDLTYNPDFSQVEADANKIDINLRSPLYYKEKRPFFLESTEIFQTPIEAVYTRQIVDPIAGIKLSGRIGDYSIGLLSAVDDYRGSSDYLSSLNAGPSDTLQKYYGHKKAYNNIFRLKHNVFSNSILGALITDREFGDSYNRVYGLDGRFSINKNNVFTGQVLYGQSREINRHNIISDRALYADYYSGSKWLNVQFLFQDYGPDFRMENGFIARSDILDSGIRKGGVQAWRDFLWQDGFLQFYRPYLYLNTIFDYKGNSQNKDISFSNSFRDQYNTGIDLSYYYSTERFAGLEYEKHNYAINLWNHSFEWLNPRFYYFSGDAIYYSYSSPFLGRSDYYIFSLNLKPSPMFRLYFSYKLYKFSGIHDNFDYGLEQIIPRLRIDWQIGRYLSLRVINEMVTRRYNAESAKPFNSSTLAPDVLLSYAPSPGTVFYLGYHDLRSQSEGYNSGWLFKDYRQNERGFFLKLSYLFRVQ